MATATMTDADLQRDVLEELKWEPSVDADHVGVSVKDGVVTLTGHVSSFAEKYAAERAAKRVHGVKAVANELDVKLPGDRKRTDEDVARDAVNALKANVSVPFDDIKVTATMRARHLPPYFVRNLADEQKNILDQGFNVPDGARIFDDDQHPDRTEFLIGHETITEVGTDNSDDGKETVGCDQGAQNVAGGTILDCVNDDFTPQFTVKGPEFAKDNGNALPARISDP